MRNLLLLTALCCTLGLMSQDAGAINQKDGLALEGYDVVNYFRGTAVKGSPEWEATHQGVAYRFTSERNLHLFQADPDRYLPAYGGWCAYAMARSGDRVPSDPAIFKVTDDRVFLFSGKALKKWEKKEESLLRQADANWLRLPKF
jgi:YHS domain-containing protein